MRRAHDAVHHSKDLNVFFLVPDEVDRHEIKCLGDCGRVVSKIGEKDPVLLLLYRAGGTIYLTTRP